MMTSRIAPAMTRFALIAMFVCGAAARLTAQDRPASPDLSATQQQIFRDYERFERALFDVAELARRKDPERAELLYRARSQSQEQSVLSEMQAIAELLRAQDNQLARYGPAADRQAELLARMETVLKLLQSLDDRERINAEIERIQALLKDTSRLIARQKDVRAETQRGTRQSGQLQDAQQKVADEAQELADKIDGQDQQRSRDSSDSPSESREGGQQGDPQDSQDGTPKPSDSSDSPEESPGKESGTDSPTEEPGEPGEPSEESPSGEPAPGQSSEGQNPPGESGQPQSGQPQSGSPQQSQGQSSSQSGQQSSPATPGREQLEQARQEMQQAIEELEQENRDQASEEQEQAITRLEELKAQLEEILRQLREEERESYLTLLEARFQNMLKRQQRINSETTRLNGIAEADRAQQNYASQTDNIRKEQEDNALEAEKALHLLQQEGSSVAFPEAVEQMYRNMRLVVGRLSHQDTGEMTQRIERMIIQTLDEMITALRKELEKSQEQRQQQAGGSGGEQDRSLVDQLAELKLIRSLENQIYLLHTEIGTELDRKAPTTSDQIELLKDLEIRQRRIREATDDLSVGRNR